MITALKAARVQAQARPILARLSAPDQCSGRTRRAFAGLGLLAAILALTSVAAPLALVLLGVAAVLLTGWALYGEDGRALRRFVVLNGVAVLLLTWGATERSELVIERTPDEIDVSLNGVRLTASLAGIESPLDRVAVELSAVDERPVAAPWMFEALPWLAGFGDWLEGGMRGGVERLRVIDVNSSDLVPPLIGLWQPDHLADPPRMSGPLEPWQVAQPTPESVVLLSPAVPSNSYRVVASTVRPSGQLRVTLADAGGGTALEVIAAPDRRLFEVATRLAGGSPETLVGGPFVYRRSSVGWLQALARELGRVWLVALGLVAAARLLAIPSAASVRPLSGVLSTIVTALAAALLGLTALTLTGLVAVYLLDGIPHTVESIAYMFQAEVLSRGGMWVPAPLLPEFFHQAYIAATPDGRWFGVLPPGQSLLLAAGISSGVPWLVSPLATALAIGLTVVLGRLTYGMLTGVVAGALLLFSPFVLMLSGDMLAHPAGLLLTVLMLLGTVAGVRDRAPDGGPLAGPAAGGWLLAGLAMGGLVLTRPFAALGIGVPLTVALVVSGRGTPPRTLVVRALLFMLAAAPGVIYAAYFNAAMTGSASLPPLSMWSDVDRIGFGPDVGTRGGHDLATALGNTWANIAVLLRHLYGWPSYLTLAFAFVPFVLGSWNRWDRLLLVCTLGLIVAHWLYWSDGIMYGPRFTFEVTAAIALLTARGAALLARANGTVPAEAVVEWAAGPVARPVEARDAAALLQASGAKGIPATLPDGSVPTAALESTAVPESTVAGAMAAESEAPCSGPKPTEEPPAPIDVAPRRALSAAPFVAALVAALFAINLVGYLPELVLAYRDYNGVSRAGLRVVEEAGLDQAVVFVTSDWPDWQSYGQVFLANSPFLDGPVIYARDLGETENWRLMTRYAERRWWLLRDLELSEIRR